MATYCPFCSVADDRIIHGTEHGLALLDGYPVSDGHTLVVPKRHVASIFDLSETEQADLWLLVAQVRERLRASGADAVNIGVNDGEAAGQTVDHAHIHVVPRRLGDVADPRGGVRWVLPETADYWSERSD